MKKGDSAGGTEQLLLAIADAPLNPSEKLFTGVISQIPLNLYLRSEPAAAVKAAQDIEAKFGSDPKRLLTLAGYYISTEQGARGDATGNQGCAAWLRISPRLMQDLALALHISLRLEEAAAEYKRCARARSEFKVGPAQSCRSRSRLWQVGRRARGSIAMQLEADPADKAARTGVIISLLDLGRTDEAKGELEKAIAADPRNVTLLAGAAYWFAAHNDNEMALSRSPRRAVAVEPRYTWSQIALARALVAQRRPLEAERGAAVRATVWKSFRRSTTN